MPLGYHLMVGWRWIEEKGQCRKGKPRIVREDAILDGVQVLGNITSASAKALPVSRINVLWSLLEKSGARIEFVIE